MTYKINAHRDSLCFIKLFNMLLVVVVLLRCIGVPTVQAVLGSDYTFPAGVLLKDGQKFDYIVVGAGAAGAAAASRLALAGQEVLLIEAGGDPNIISKIPGAAMGLLGSEIDWQYETISNNKSCLSSTRQHCRFSRGKCLGGSTSINFMLYSRGNRLRDFEEIPFPNWSFDDLMPYFLRYEGLRDLDELPPSSIPFHNTTGNMRIEFFDDPENPWQSRLIRSYMSLQFPFNYDVNAETQIGVTKIVGYVYKGQRMSTARGYLARNDVKERLIVAKNTFCTGVIIKRNIARGVTARQGFLDLRLYARKEVILSAGAIGTPQILMLSGIGPAEHLRAMGISVKQDLPVGDGLTDHALPLLIVKVDRGLSIVGKIQRAVNAVTQLGEFLVASRGALASNGITDVNVFTNSHCYDFTDHRPTNVSSDGSDCQVPNLQINHAYIERNLITLVKPLFRQAIPLNEDVIDQLADANRDHAFIIFSPVLLEPRSEGTVRLASKDPFKPPAIFPNYLGDDADVDNLITFVRIVEDLLQTRAFRKRNASFLILKLAGCPDYEVDRELYWRCYVRHMTNAVFHSAGTAALGRVLDARLRVLGVQRLRVADLGALPRAPRANPAAVSIAVGERVADFVLEDNK
ncbi:ecdysone oxidase-like [Anticarsia gemmatalis]|uniref:ecdysone oxidase-like n=1 Tax=Anticarsia gemmatalis TaxID=129554 RepID=UPI003F776B44